MKLKIDVKRFDRRTMFADIPDPCGDHLRALNNAK